MKKYNVSEKQKELFNKIFDLMEELTAPEILGLCSSVLSMTLETATPELRQRIIQSLIAQINNAANEKLN